MNQIVIRAIAGEDAEGFHSCLDAVARERKFLGFVEAPPLEETRQWLLEGMEKGELRFIAVDGPQVVGWCDIEIRGQEGFTHSGRLGMGVVRPYRGKGIGTALVGRALEEARDRRLERVELEVYGSNPVAVGLYERFGFQVEGRKRRARKIDARYDDIVVMALILDDL